jgi:ABC-2 type transport system permease protein
MSINRIKAILLQELYITIHSMEVILDIIVFPAMSVVVFGFLSIYLAGSSSSYIGQALLMGMLLWQVVFIMQYSISVGSLWNMWSRNLSNMFVTPISLSEYVFSYFLSGVLKVCIILGITSALIAVFFGFNLFQIGILNVILLLVNLIFFAFSMGMVILGLIFRYGTKIQAFAWGLLPILQPLAAALYPVKVLPIYLQVISYALPPTYVFETARGLLANPVDFNWRFMLIGLAENVVLLIIALAFFNYMFKRSKETGQFARSEG